MSNFDLLKQTITGGCSAKLPAKELSKALAGLPKTPHPMLLVDIESHDDAGVFKINDEMALIQTTDFFPPVCSDPYEFGQIAAANALSDVYAMGGQVLSVLNIVTYPAHYPLEGLRQILKGGIDKVIEAGGVVMGGHTIVDDTPKYGLAVTGVVHPERVITNTAAKDGDLLILTKPIGSGIVLAGHRIGEATDEDLSIALTGMKQLNKNAAHIMQNYHIKCATDITGFGLLGHALKMALGSNVTMHIKASTVPVFEKAVTLADMGCLPGACFRNLEYVEKECIFDKDLNYNLKMTLLDAQTSGGLLIACPKKDADNIIKDLKSNNYLNTEIIGHVTKKESFSLHILK